MKKDMTSGNIYKQLIAFTIPLVLGNLFQLTYNAADSIIVGRFIGENALAAVGAAAPLMNIVIFFISGICMGASIIMSQFFGAKEIDKLKKEVSTSLIAGIIFSLVVTVLGILLARPLLQLIRTPEEIIDMSAIYLQTIIFGLSFTFLYNFYSNTLRALGDSSTPLLFLIISAVSNIFMDILMITVFRMGVFGCALATVIAEMLSAIFCMIYVQKKMSYIRINRNFFVFDYTLFKKTVSFSITSALQQATLYIGKLLVQAAVNPLGVDAIAAFNAVNKIDDFAYTPQQNIGHAMTTFIAQNKGADNPSRMKKGFKIGLLIELGYVIILMAVLALFKNNLMSLFVTDNASNVITMGVSYISLMIFFYILPGLTNGVQGYFRGIGDLKITLLSTFMNMLGRVVAAYLLAEKLGIIGLAYANLAGWILMLLVELPLLWSSIKQLKAIT